MSDADLDELKRKRYAAGRRSREAYENRRSLETKLALAKQEEFDSNEEECVLIREIWSVMEGRKI